MSRAILIGAKPPIELGYTYVDAEPYDGVVIGSLSIGELLQFGEERVLTALSEGKPVVLYAPGLPDAPKNRALACSLAEARRKLKNWGVLFTDGKQKRLVTADVARAMREKGIRPEDGAVLTPLAREILEGTT